MVRDEAIGYHALGTQGIPRGRLKDKGLSVQQSNERSWFASLLPFADCPHAGQ